MSSSKHLAEDLCPFTCIMADCSKPMVLFATKQEWEKHTLEHHSSADYWICPLCPRVKYEGLKPSVNTLQFATETAFEHHLLQTHTKAVSATMLPSLLDNSKRTAPVELSECPLCGTTNTSNKLDKMAFMEHISIELRSFAMRSLPWHDRRDAGVALTDNTQTPIEGPVQNDALDHDEFDLIEDTALEVTPDVPMSAAAKVKAWLISLQFSKDVTDEFHNELPYDDNPTPSVDQEPRVALSAEDRIAQWKKFLHDEKTKFGIDDLAPLSRSEAEERQHYFHTNEYFLSDTKSLAPLAITRTQPSDDESDKSQTSKTASSTSSSIVQTQQSESKPEKPIVSDTPSITQSAVTQTQQSEIQPVKLAEPDTTSSTTTQQQENDNLTAEQSKLPVSNTASPGRSAIAQTQWQERDNDPVAQSGPDSATHFAPMRKFAHPPDSNRPWRFDATKQDWFYFVDGNQRVYHNSTPRTVVPGWQGHVNPVGSPQSSIQALLENTASSKVTEGQQKVLDAGK
jgi:hypothetical protein